MTFNQNKNTHHNNPASMDNRQPKQSHIHSNLGSILIDIVLKQRVVIRNIILCALGLIFHCKRHRQDICKFLSSPLSSYKSRGMKDCYIDGIVRHSLFFNVTMRNYLRFGNIVSKVFCVPLIQVLEEFNVVTSEFL